jgi:hypothetical protein
LGPYAPGFAIDLGVIDRGMTMLISFRLPIPGGNEFNPSCDGENWGEQYPALLLERRGEAALSGED